ncbi:dihydrouridine synthase [Salpingoeca rosetta]|uniref:tRNA-dihydrouridine(16/17) synthase [NAD(P)(+)] n=1 Tax=Salpingoeca rosetta (strain ATCC 50818 / BSB-021) TaxID=946362 RepID=F2U3P8_SALR5|nr:dihydrouridine synthase [Salpingoeca rosetta]EGD82242.1 dihydrouridine synthase [Salpingoeca rosetta]|eukprot:XP_004996425.1 dihydrouridine synthase [Salpingoeca rosetta]
MTRRPHASSSASGASAAWAWWRSLGSPRYVCAPMVWQSETAFRRLVTAEGGCDLAYTPMMHADQLLENNLAAQSHLTDLRQDMERGRPYPLLGQLCATNADDFVQAAQLVEPYVDAVDLNLGCPQRTAQAGGFGAFLMEHPDTVAAIVQRASTTLQVPVCCKIRVFTDVDKTVAFARMLQESGCSMLAVHGRTRAQRHHEGTPHYDTVRAIVEALDIPVVVNGGIATRQQADAILRHTGACATMSATGLLACPLMYTGVAASETTPFEHAHKYLEYACRYPPPCARYIRDHVLALFRSHFANYAHIDVYNMMARNMAVRTAAQYLCCVRVLASRCELSSLPGRLSDVPVLTLRRIKNLTGDWPLHTGDGWEAMLAALTQLTASDPMHRGARAADSHPIVASGGDIDGGGGDIDGYNNDSVDLDDDDAVVLWDLP